MTTAIVAFVLVAAAAQPGDTITVHLSRLRFQSGTQVKIGGMPAIVARVASPSEAEVIVPLLREGVAQIVAANGTDTEKAGEVVIIAPPSRRLTLLIKPGTIQLAGTELYKYAAPSCGPPPSPQEGLLFYEVRIDGNSDLVGCGVVRELKKPEYFTEKSPYHDGSGDPYFTIIVPWNPNEKVYFTATGSLSKLFNLSPDRKLVYPPIEVPY